MDNTDQPNQNIPSSPLSGATPPSLNELPPVQININTPPVQSSAPVTTSSPTNITTTENPTVVPGSYQPVPSGLDNPVFVAPPSVVAPVVTPMGVAGTTVSTTTTTSTELPTPTETPAVVTTEPTKKGMSPILTGLLIVAFLAIAGAGVFMVSRVTSGQQAVAPTAPESEPAAFEAMPNGTSESGVFNPDEVVDCSAMPNTAPYGNECRATITDEMGNVTWADGTVTPQTSTSETPIP